MDTPDTNCRSLRWNASTFVLIGATLVFAALYAGYYLKRGWIPIDDGSFGQTAERVLSGELPHHDFDDVYTGGQAFINALAMRIGGVNLGAIRFPLYVLFLLWVPAVFAIARRFVSDLAAAFVTVLAICCSFPNYPAAVASWYNLFFATFGVLALCRYAESSRAIWLFVAGVFAGLSFDIKLSGAYFLAAVLLYLAFREQELDATAVSRASLSIYSMFIVVCCAAFVLVLLKLINFRADLRYVMHFVVPGTALAAFLVWREFNSSYVGFPTRFRNLLVPAAILLAGFLVPILIFLAPYFAKHAVGDWIRGVFVLPAKRFAFASTEPFRLKPSVFLSSGVLVSALLYSRHRKSELSRIAAVVLALVLAAAVVISGKQTGAYRILWYSLVLLIPFTTLAVAWLMQNRSAESCQRLFLLTSTAALCSLIQYPFAAPIYLLYALPLVLFIWAALIGRNPDYSRLLTGILLFTFIAFFALRITPSFVYSMGYKYEKANNTYRMSLPRAGGLLVDPDEGREFEQLIPAVREHLRGRYMFATPDAPEVLFLAGALNPTRTIFDFFDDPATHRKNVLTALAQHDVNVVVLRRVDSTGRDIRNRAFSRLDLQLADDLRQIYPHFEFIGNFEVRWRE